MTMKTKTQSNLLRCDDAKVNKIECDAINTANCAQLQHHCTQIPFVLLWLYKVIISPVIIISKYARKEN